MALKAFLRRQNKKKILFPDSEFQVKLEAESTVKETDF